VTPPFLTPPSLTRYADGAVAPRLRGLWLWRASMPDGAEVVDLGHSRAPQGHIANGSNTVQIDSLQRRRYNPAGPPRAL